MGNVHDTTCRTRHVIGDFSLDLISADSGCTYKYEVPYKLKDKIKNQFVTSTKISLWR